MRIHSFVRFGLGALVGGVASLIAAEAHAASTCDPATLSCAVGTADGLTAKITKKLGTEIDSGWMEKGSIKIRTRFTIDPVGSDPLASVGMTKGALVEATWPEKGFLSLRPLTADGADGAMSIHYTLTPSLDANIYGIGVSYDASQLINMIPGASFHYDSQAGGKMVPWGFAGASVAMPSPALDQSTLFSISFADLGVDPGIVEGSLAIQAAAKPTFKYTTKEVRMEGSAVTTADGTAKIPVGDVDSIDVTAYVTGALEISGNLDVKPVVTVDTVDGYPTFGLVKFGFSAVSKEIAAPPTSLSFDRATIHVPLPNVKVPATPLDMGTAKAGGQTSKKISIDSTGEMDGLLTFTSSDPQFVVPGDKVRVPSKSKYDLEVQFKPSGDGPASADITVHSNDPDSPDQVFHVAANGAALNPSDPKSESSGGGDPSAHDESNVDSSGCSFAPRGATGGLGAFGLGLGLALLARRRRAR
jgi:hypothetical protein